MKPDSTNSTDAEITTSETSVQHAPAGLDAAPRARVTRWLKRSAITLAALIALVWSGASAFVYFKQGSIVYLPTRYLIKTPREAGLVFEDLRLPVKRASGSSEQIHLWWLPAPAQAANGMSVLFLHGNARNMGAVSNADKVTTLARAGFYVLTLDYRGYGTSDGDAPYEAALYEDTAVALDEFKRRAPDASKRILHGHSMGGAVAIDLATKRPQDFIAAFIEATFTSMLDMSTLNPVYRALPIDTLLTERFESARKIGSLKLPVLFIHGTHDARIPAAMSQQLFGLAPQPKSMILVAGATHNNLHTFPDYANAYRLLLEMAKK